MMADLIGQQFGNYQLIRLLGEGGFAKVYLGEHVHLGTQAAIKVLHTQLSNDDIEHFRSEARIIASLEHPNIVRILDFGVEGKVPFLVMSHAPFGTLRQLHPKSTSLPLATVVSYVKQVAEALQYAHDQRLIHRDVKPENMLVSKRNEVLLSDFGIALVMQSSFHQPTPDVGGTVAYMAPEQIQGKPVQASDQYALGVVVYEWISSVLPFQGKTFHEIAIQHAIAQPPPLHEKLPSLKSNVEKVIMMALAKEPHHRFATVRAFANALEQASQSEQPHSFPVAQRPEDAAYPFKMQQIESAFPATPYQQPSHPGIEYPPLTGPQPIQGRISRRAVLIGVTGLALASGGLAWWKLSQPSSSPQKNTLTPILSSRATPTSTTGSNPSPTVVAMGTQIYIYHGHSKGIGAVAWSPPDGQRIASGSGDNTVQVWDATSGNNKIVYTGHSQAVQSVAWSPDGQRIASGGNDKTVQVWNALTGSSLFTYYGHTDIVWAVAWSPGGKYIASAGVDQTVQVWDATSGNLVYKYNGHNGVVYALAWSQDSNRIASASTDQTVQLWNSTSGNNVLTYSHHSGLVTSVAWSPDGSQIASSAQDKTVQIWNPNTASTLITCRGHFGQVNTVTWSFDGKQLVSGSSDRTAIVWASTSGSRIYTYRGHSDSVWSVAWCPDGQRVASSGDDRTVQVWQAE